MSEPAQPVREIPSWARDELLGLVAQSSTEFHYIQSSDGTLDYVSPSVHRLLGYDPEAFAANCHDIPDWNSPRTREARAMWDAHRDDPPGQFLPPYLIDVRHRDGSRRTQEVHECWGQNSAGERYLVGLSRDVTQRVIAETKFDLVQRLTGVVNYFGDITPEGARTVYLGPTFERLYGVPREEVMEDATAFLRNIHPEDAGEFGRAVSSIFAGQGPDRWRYRYRVVHPDGRTLWVSDRGVIERGMDGGPRRWIGLAEDVTEQVHTEEEHRREEAMRVQSQKLEIVGQLAAGVAHNFSNLLLAIQGYIGLAQRTLEPNHPAIEALSKIEETSEQARGLTRGLLTLAHRQPAQQTPLDLSASLEGTIRLLRRTLPTTVRVVHRIEPGVAVLGDASQIDQIVLNTALNARDAMPDGGELTISLCRENGHARLVIADTGHGMDTPTRERAFEPFFTTKAPESGTGLGLSISRGIVAECGGSIELHSEPGRGTRVEISLPILSTESGPRVSEALPVTAGGTVLLVHPSGLVQRVVRTMIVELGYEVCVASSRGDALEQLARGEATAMLIDPATAWLAEQADPEGAVGSLLASAGSVRVVLVTDEPDRWAKIDLGPGGELLPRPFMRMDLAVALNAAPAS